MNLEWVVASAFERKHQRQVESGAAPGFSTADAGREEPGPREEDPASASPRRPVPESVSREQPPQTSPGEDEVAFPGLDELLQPSKQPARSAGTTHQGDTHDLPRSGDDALGAGNRSLRAPDNEEEPLDLGLLVQDLGLEIDNSLEESDPAQGTEVPGHPRSTNR